MYILVNPQLEYASEFKALVWDYIQNREAYFMTLYKPALEDFEHYIDTLKAHSRGHDLPRGWVPYSTFWLYSTDTKTIAGNIRFRYQRVEEGDVGYDIRPSMRGMGLGTKLLELGLQKAKSIGFNELYISVDSNNESSIRIIESNGGLLFENRIDSESYIENIVYRITLR